MLNEIEQRLAERERCFERCAVSRETAADLDVLVAELLRWQAAKNLVSPSTLTSVWTRHILDSLQLRACAPAEAQAWLDLGAGGGFPGLVLGIQLKSVAGGHISLVESNGRKCAFLRHVATILKLPVTVINGRIEDVLQRGIAPVDVVTARALAPLAQLLAWTDPLLTRGSIGLFPKGQDVASELTVMAKYPTLQAELLPSLSDPEARIVRVTSRSGASARSDQADLETTQT